MNPFEINALTNSGSVPFAYLCLIVLRSDAWRSKTMRL